MPHEMPACVFTVSAATTVIAVLISKLPACGWWLGLRGCPRKGEVLCCLCVETSAMTGNVSWKCPMETLQNEASRLKAGHDQKKQLLAVKHWQGRSLPDGVSSKWGRASGGAVQV